MLSNVAPQAIIAIIFSGEWSQHSPLFYVFTAYFIILLVLVKNSLWNNRNSFTFY